MSAEIQAPWTATVVGQGNTGSAVALLLARVAGIRELRLIDHDRVEPKNIVGQSVASRASMGVAKAKALAAAIRRIRSNLRVVPIVERVENVPPGEAFGVTVVFSNVDSRDSRRYMSEMGLQLGVPVIDCGVHAEERLVRVTNYLPEPDLACFVCGLDPAGGQSFEQTYACGDTFASPAPTDAPAWLGALAAAFQVAEFEKIVSPGPSHLLSGKELLVNARFHQHSVSRLPRNPACPFHHTRLEIESVACTPGDLTIARAFALALPPGTASGRNLPRLLRGMHLSLQVPTKQFVKHMQCGACGHAVSLLRLRHRLRTRDLICARCGGAMVPVPHDIVDRLYPRNMGRALSCSMYSVGFSNGDLFTVLDPGGEARHFQFRAERGRP